MARTRDDLIPVHIKEKKKRYRRRRIFAFALFIILVFASSIFLLRLPFLLINHVEVEGNLLIDKETIANTVEDTLEEYYFWVIPKRNILFAPTHAIEESLQATYPRISNIDVKTKSDALVVSIKEREGRYLWCGMNAPIYGNTVGSCFYMDDKGYLFSNAPYFSLGVYFTFFGGAIDVKDPVGQTLLTPEKLQTLLTLRDSLQNLNLRPRYAYVASESVYEIYLARISDTEIIPTKIIARFEDDPKTLVTNLSAALANPGFQSEYKGNEDKLLYFDLRFPNKVYYKFSK